MKALVFLLPFFAGLALTAQPVQADDPVLPGAGFSASRYQALWTKPPLAVATAEAGQDTSPDYLLYGIANVDGITYASVVDAHSQEHFLISTDKATRGLTLTSISRSSDGSGTYANVLKDGQTITLKLQQASGTAGVPGAPTNFSMPGAMTQQITMPGANLPGPGAIRPFIPRFRRPLIHLPPPPNQQQQPGQPAPSQ
jgi:hypothetical protein